jgi:hypothetical protein
VIFDTSSSLPLYGDGRDPWAREAAAVQLLLATSGDITPQLNSSEKNGGAKMMKTVVGVFNDFTTA